MTAFDETGVHGRAAELILAILQREHLKQLRDGLHTHASELSELVRLISQIPAPTFMENRRGDMLQQLLEQATRQTIESDALGNRWVSLQGAYGLGPRILVSAHLDTVFPSGTDCSVHMEAGKLLGPGVGDNAASLAVLVKLGQILCEAGRPFAGVLILAANVAEEGLGDLRGMRALCARFAGELDAALALDGALGNIVGAAVGSVRYRIRVQGPGGHSWSDFGTPSAIDLLVRIAAALSMLRVPEEPMTTFNLGTIQGGTSVNSIASQAELTLDLRSIDALALKDLEQAALTTIRAYTPPEQLTLTVHKIGDRPTGDIKLTQPWQEIASAVWSAQQIPLKVTSSSTDANIPLSLGIPASTLGTHLGGRAHTLEEWLDPESLPVGLEAALNALLVAFEYFTRRQI